jgi:hypothetical protein
MKRISMVAFCLTLAAFIAPTVASAQTNFPTAGGARADGRVLMCLDANGNAVPATAAGTCLGSGGGGGGASNAQIGSVYPSTGSAASGAVALVNGTTAAMTATTATQVLAAVATKKLFVTFVKCNNSHATVSTLVQITDGSGGTVLNTLAAAAAYGGEVNQNFLPLFSTTAGNGLFAQDVTTGASVICTASGFSQ